MTAGPARPAPTLRGGAPPARGRQRQILWLAVIVIAIAVVFRACATRENSYEHTAHELTQAVAANDMATVQKLENSETAAEMTRARLGRASDTIAPLGKIKRVKEVPAQNVPPRTHEFDVTFEKGTIHEKIQFDPEGKVVHFRYDQVKTS